MTDQLIDHEPVKVHLAASDVPLTPVRRRCRRGVSFRTFTLTTSDPVQQILPLNLNRVEAWVQSFTNASYLYSSLGEAQTGAGTGGVKVPVASGSAAYPVNTTDAVWVTATAFPTTVCITAIIEEP
jgi:hypothetical protein